MNSMDLTPIKKVIVYSLSQRRILYRVGDKSTGMVMCIKLTQPSIIKTKFNLFAGYENGQVIVWEMNDGSVSRLKSISCFDDPVMSLDVFNDKLLVTGSHDYILYCKFQSELNGQEELFKVEMNSQGHGQSSWRCDGKLVAIGGWNGQVQLFSKRLKPLGTLQLHKDSITDISFSSRNWIAVASSDKRLSLWKVYAE